MTLRTLAREHSTDLTLEDLEDRLGPQRFRRIHRGVIVAIAAVGRVGRSFGGRYAVSMRDSDHHRFEIGRSFLTVVRARPDF